MLLILLKRGKVTAVSLLIAVTSLGQELKELKSRYQLSNDNWKKGELASELSWFLKDSNPHQSYYYAKKALSYAKKSHNKKVIAYSLADIGNYFKRMENYPDALNYYMKSLLIRKDYGDISDISSIYNQIGLLYRQREKFDSAVFYFNEGLKVLPQKKYLDIRMKILDGLGMSLYRQGHYKIAIEHINQSRKFAEVLKDSLSIAQSWQNLGVINQYHGYSYMALIDYKKAKRYFKSIENLKGTIDCQINTSSIYLIQGHFDEAEKILLNALNESLDEGFNDNLSTIYLKLAQIYGQTENKKAYHYYLKALNYGVEYDKTETQIEGNLGLANYLLAKGNLEEAKTYISELDKLINVQKKIIFKSQYYDLKAEYARRFGNFEKAFLLSQKSMRIKDSLYSEIISSGEFHASLKILEEEKRALNEVIKRKNVEAKAGRLLLIILALVVLTLVIIIYFVRRNLQIKKEQKVSELNLESKISEIIYQSDLKVLEGGIELRKKIGRDLHDNLGSKLAVAQMRIDSLATKPSISVERELIEISSLIENSCMDLRNISHDLVNGSSDHGALDQAIQVLCLSIPQNDKFEIVFNTIGQTFVISLLEKRNLIATISLLLDNVIKHANASLVHLQIFYHEDSINIELEDNGTGFDVNKKASGIGLKNAFNRIELLHGIIEVNSNKNRGTSISISIPKQQKND